MSASAPAFVRSWPVGLWTCTLIVPALQPGQPTCAVMEWEPAVPARLSKTEASAYRAGRDEALGAMASELGITVALVDL